MKAIASHPYDDIAPPDLDNRALSLCEWVAADIDKEVRDMLSQVGGAEAGWVTSHPLALILQRELGVRGWTHSWTVANNAGTLRKVGIVVNEANDSEVIAVVDGVDVTQATPPWISDRATPISDAAVAQRRAEFRATLLEAMRGSVLAAPLLPSYIRPDQPT
jgi:hypothetical protein